MIKQKIKTHSSSNRYIKPILTPTLIINYITAQYFLALEILIFKNIKHLRRKSKRLKSEMAPKLFKRVSFYKDQS